ncbi:MAG: hypothetical protein ACI9Z4_001709 [Polaribacter sp.]
MKTYNQFNFFKHTFCEFQQVDKFDFPEETNYKSKSESMYFYTDEGVYRKSNHWGRVANCRWKIIANNTYKNQQIITGFAKWTNFYPINLTEKIFFIAVNFEEKTAILQPKRSASMNYFFTFSVAQKKIKEITYLFQEDAWAKYFETEVEELRFKIISEYMRSEKSVQEIKRDFK